MKAPRTPASSSAASSRTSDFDALYAAGATAIFPPGTVIADSAIKMLEVLEGDGADVAAE